MRASWADTVMTEGLGGPAYGPLDRLANAGRRWPLALGVFLAVAILAVVGAFLVPAVHESRATLLITPQPELARLNGESLAGANSMAAIVDAEVDRINSRAMAVALAGANPADADRIDHVLRASRERGAYVINIAARSPDAAEAERIAAAAVAAYMSGIQGPGIGAAAPARPARPASQLLGDQLAAARASLDARVAERDRILASPEYRAAQSAPVARPVADTANARLQAARQAQSDNTRRNTALKAFWRSGVTAAETARLRASGLLAELGPDGARLSAAIDQYQAALAATPPDASAQETARFQVETALALLTAQLDSKAPALAADVRSAQAAAGAAPSVVSASAAEKLKAQVQTLDQQIGEGRGAVEALSRLQAAAVDEPASAAAAMSGLTSARIVAPASAATVPVLRQLPVMIGLGLALALVLALATLLVAELGSTRVSTQREVDAILNVPILAAAPRVSATLLRGLSPNERHPAYFAVEFPAAPFADAMRELHTEIFAGLTPGAPLVLGITAAQPGDGATTIALALARTAVSAGQRVLLIDGDLDSGGLTRALGMEPTAGIEAVIDGQGRLLELVIGDDVSAAHILTVNAPTPPLSLSHLTTLKAALESARPAYDVIIVDCSGIAGRGRAIVRLVERVVVVVGAGVTRRNMLHSLGRRLQQSGVKVAGAVLNLAPMSRSQQQLAARQETRATIRGGVPTPGGWTEQPMTPRRSLH